MIYFISDTHFGHKGSLNWPNGENREFKDVKEMNKVIIDNWNSVVKEEDTVYHLGDFSYKTSNSTIKHIFDSLKGKIILIKGNHDGQTLKVNKNYKRFESVHDRLVLEYKGKTFILDHYPIESWMLKNRGSIHLHGHTHKRIPNIFGKIKNVSCEVINYIPISIEDIIKEMEIKLEKSSLPTKWTSYFDKEGKEREMPITKPIKDLHTSHIINILKSNYLSLSDEHKQAFEIELTRREKNENMVH